VIISVEINRIMKMLIKYIIMYRITHKVHDPHASFSAQVEFDLTDRGRCYEYPLLASPVNG